MSRWEAKKSFIQETTTGTVFKNQVAAAKWIIKTRNLDTKLNTIQSAITKHLHGTRKHVHRYEFKFCIERNE